jgi:hypothetical protein
MLVNVGSGGGGAAAAPAAGGAAAGGAAAGGDAPAAAEEEKKEEGTFKTQKPAIYGKLRSLIHPLQRRKSPTRIWASVSSIKRTAKVPSNFHHHLLPQLFYQRLPIEPRSTVLFQYAGIESARANSNTWHSRMVESGINHISRTTVRDERWPAKTHTDLFEPVTAILRWLIVYPQCQ